MRRIVFSLVAVAMVVGIAAYAVYWFTTARFVETTDNAYAEADIAVIAPKVAGYLRELPVTDNQPVRAGQPLLTIDPADYAAAVARAEADLARLRSARGTAASTATAQGSMIAEAQAQATAARAEVVRADADRDRFAKLLKERWVSAAAYEVKAADAAGRVAAVRQADAAIAAARSTRTAAVSGEGGAKASIAGAQAVLDAAKLDLANTVVRAPVDGVIGNRSARVGQYVKTGQQVMVVVPLAKVYVVANFKETQVGAMHPGMPVDLTLDAYRGQVVRGHIVSVSPAAGSRFSMLPPENATGNFTKIVQRVPVKVALDPLPAGVRLVPGMSVEASVDVRGGRAG